MTIHRLARHLELIGEPTLVRCVRCIVRGRVQGVAFRAAALAMAQGLHVTGWVRNRRDGAVEALACGEESALRTFRAWLHKGPAYAIVSDVSCAPQPWEDFSEFRIRR